MPGSKTAYLSQALLDHVLGKSLYTPPDTLYVALSLDAFDPNATGSAMNEVPLANNYARVAISNDTTQWPSASAAAPSQKSNANDIAFPTAVGDWGTPMSVYLCDAADGGNALYGADLASNTDVGNGYLFKILAGQFTFTED